MDLQYARAFMENRSRWITVAVALAAATSFALSVQSAWWSVAEVAIGPFGAHHCFGGECREAGLAWVGGSELWMRSAVATRAAGYIAMFVLIMFAGALAAKREPMLVARGAAAAILTALVAGVYFAAAYPGVPGATVARGLVEFVVAIVCGVATLVLFLRRSR
jgi:hypothetical protein